jgi:tRNA (mo5U34)-methyltransferase
VEPYVGNFAEVDLGDLGAFDVVLYLGVLYHMKEPLAALERLRRVTKEVAVVETEAVWMRHHEHEALVAFYPGDELSGDFGNWYAPNERGLHALCRAAGF